MNTDNITIVSKYIDAFRRDDPYQDGGVVYNCFKIIEGELPYVTSSSFKIDEIKVDLETERTEQIDEFRKRAVEWWRDIGFGNLFFTEPGDGGISENGMFAEIENYIESNSANTKSVEKYIGNILYSFSRFFDIYTGVESNKAIKKLLDTDISDIRLERVKVGIEQYFIGYSHKKNFTPEDFIISTWYELKYIVERLDVILLENGFDIMRIADLFGVALYLPNRTIENYERYFPTRQRVENLFREIVQPVESKDIIHPLPDGTLCEETILGWFAYRWQHEHGEDVGEQLIRDIKHYIAKGSKKSLCAMAYFIFESVYLTKISRPATFTKWCNIFFYACGVELKGDPYKPSKLSDEVKKLETSITYLRSHSR